MGRTSVREEWGVFLNRIMYLKFNIDEDPGKTGPRSYDISALVRRRGVGSCSGRHDDLQRENCGPVLLTPTDPHLTEGSRRKQGKGDLSRRLSSRRVCVEREVV